MSQGIECTLFPPERRWGRAVIVLRAELLAPTKHKIPAGFTSDGASTPRLLWWLLPPWGQYARSAILHDYLLAQGTPWAEAAWWLDESLRVEGIRDYRRWLITAGVLAWGGWLWAKRALSRVVARWRG